MTVEELAKDYEHQYEIIKAKMDGLVPLLLVYKGEDLLQLRKKIKIYYDMAEECKSTAELLKGYYDE